MTNTKTLKLKTSIKVVIVLIIGLLLVGTYFLKEYLEFKKPLRETWAQIYYLYLSDKKVKGLNDVEEVDINFYDVKEDNPVMVITYDKDNLEYFNIYGINNNKADLIVSNCQGSIELLYNIKEDSYEYYYHSINDDSDIYQKLSTIIDKKDDSYSFKKNEKDSIVDINGNEISLLKFDQELIKVEVENEKVIYNLKSNKKELKRLMNDSIDIYKDKDDLITLETMTMVNEKINDVNSQKEKMQKAVEEIQKHEEEERKKKEEEERKKKEEEEKKKEESKYATSIAVLNYHFFYDKKTEKCNESICIDIENFENQLKYLKDNGYKTLTIEEFKKWMYKEMELPKKSVLITIDDGAMGTSKINGNKLIPLLEKYQIHATLFLITGWWDKENYISDYLDVQSHTHLMHEEGVCSNKTRGAKMLCSTKEEVKADLQKSISALGSNTAFCFPFYVSDSKSIEVLKELNFKIAFVGGNQKATRNSNKYKIPRYVVYKNTSLNSFKTMIS